MANEFQPVVNLLRNIERQIPFARAVALNRTAKKVQDHELKRELPGKLKVRGTWARPGVKFGVNIRFAKKTDDSAEVFSRAPWLDFQERGGTKTPSGKVLLIPKIGGARPTAGAVVVRRLKPRKGNAKIFFHPKFKGVFRQVGRGKNKRLQMLFSFTTGSARVKKRISFEQTGAQIAAQNFGAEFDRAYRDALLTSL